MTLDQLKIGTEVYYTGDVANIDGYGKVVKQYDDKWGQCVDIVLDDGRTFHRTTVSGFDSQPGRRWCIKSVFIAERQAIIDDLTTKQQTTSPGNQMLGKS